MLQVHVLSHKDGNNLAIFRVPWWMPIFEFVWHRFCPCCGVSGWLSRFEWLGSRIYDLSNHAAGVMLKVEEEVYRIPIVDVCEVSSKLWPKSPLCWKDNCEYHPWEGGSDSFDSSEGRRHVLVNWMVQFVDWCKLTCLKPIKLLRGKFDSR